MVKILHASDMHFDCKFSDLSPLCAKIRRDELKMSFEKLLKNAYDNECRVFLLAGDVFDSDSFMTSTVRFLANLFSKYNDAYFFIALGNHDSLKGMLYSNLVENLPRNAHIFGEKIKEFEIRELGLRVYGVSFSSEFEYTSMLEGFSVRDDDMINIMVMHGDVGNVSEYNPISLGDIEKKRS